MSTVQSIWNGLDWSYLTNMLLGVIPALICITLHELAHGVAAYRLSEKISAEKEAVWFPRSTHRYILILQLSPYLTI